MTAAPHRGEHVRRHVGHFDVVERQHALYDVIRLLRVLERVEDGVLRAHPRASAGHRVDDSVVEQFAIDVGEHDVPAPVHLLEVGERPVDGARRQHDGLSGVAQVNGVQQHAGVRARQRLSQHALVPQQRLVHELFARLRRARPPDVLPVLLEREESVHVHGQPRRRVAVVRQRQEAEHVAVGVAQLVDVIAGSRHVQRHRRANP